MNIFLYRFYFRCRLKKPISESLEIYHFVAQYNPANSKVYPVLYHHDWDSFTTLPFRCYSKIHHTLDRYFILILLPMNSPQELANIAHYQNNRAGVKFLQANSGRHHTCFAHSVWPQEAGHSCAEEFMIKEHPHSFPVHACVSQLHSNDTTHRLPSIWDIHLHAHQTSDYLWPAGIKFTALCYFLSADTLTSYKQAWSLAVRHPSNLGRLKCQPYGSNGTESISETHIFHPLSFRPRCLPCCHSPIAEQQRAELSGM